MGCRAGPWKQCARLMSYPAQSFLSVFRSLATVEKTVEKCCISLSGSHSHLVVQLHCKYGEQVAGPESSSECGGSGSGGCQALRQPFPLPRGQEDTQPLLPGL